MAPTHVDLEDIINRLFDRAQLLQLAAEGLDRPDKGAVAQLAEDIRTDLATLLDGLQNLEGDA